MDEYLSDINAQVFLEYIKNYNYQTDTKITETRVEIYTPYSQSHIEMYEGNIFELCVENLSTNENVFYLHFQMKTMKHAIDLFEEMIELIQSLTSKPTTKILLSCTGGLTTGYFAEMLNDSAKILGKDYSFDAVPYSEIEGVCENFDMILLAPQIAYQQAKLQAQLPHKLILSMPAKVFASYDTGKMISLIEETQIQQREEKQNYTILSDIDKKHGEILTLIIIRNSMRLHVGYRLFGKNNDILEDGEIVKTKLTLQDIFDLVDTISLKHKHIDAITITLPGIINDGLVTSTHVEGWTSPIHFQDIFEQRYHKKTLLLNDVNAVAIGYHSCQNKYKDISVIFQPVSATAGIGHVVNNEIQIGYKSIAGEIQFLPLVLSQHKFELNKTVKGTIELLAQEILSIIVSVAPEQIVVCSSLLPGTEVLKEELKKYIPEIYIPELTQITYLQDYSFIGGLIYAIREL